MWELMQFFRHFPMQWNFRQMGDNFPDVWENRGHPFRFPLRSGLVGWKKSINLVPLGRAHSFFIELLEMAPLSEGGPPAALPGFGSGVPCLWGFMSKAGGAPIGFGIGGKGLLGAQDLGKEMFGKMPETIFLKTSSIESCCWYRIERAADFMGQDLFMKLSQNFERKRWKVRSAK